MGSTVSSIFIIPLSFLGSLLLFTSLLLLGLTLSIEVSWIALINKIQQSLLSSGSSFGEKLSELILNLREKQKLRQEKLDRQEKVVINTKVKEQTKPAEVIKPKPKIEKSKRVEQELSLIHI